MRERIRALKIFSLEFRLIKKEVMDFFKQSLCAFVCEIFSYKFLCLCVRSLQNFYFGKMLEFTGFYIIKYV